MPVTISFRNRTLYNFCFHERLFKGSRMVDRYGHAAYTIEDDGHAGASRTMATAP